MKNKRIENQGSAINYLIDYKDGKIKKGLGLGCNFDRYFVYKPREMVTILGHDNVGKSAWMTWYFLCLVLKYDLQVCIWSGENHKGQIMRDLIQMTMGEPFLDLSHNQIRRCYLYLENHFEFVDNTHLYKPHELLDVFGSSDAQICLIDPYTGLDREMTYEGNYRFLNECRQFVNKTRKTIYINTHPTSESGRSGMIFQEGDFKGMLKPPLRSHVEGGKAFLNRVDNMLICHRMPGSKTMRYFTMIQVEKIKDKETGGEITPHEEPVLFEYNYGLGFKINGVDPLKPIRPTWGSKQKIMKL